VRGKRVVGGETFRGLRPDGRAGLSYVIADDYLTPAARLLRQLHRWPLSRSPSTGTA